MSSDSLLLFNLQYYKEIISTDESARRSEEYLGTGRVMRPERETEHVLPPGIIEVLDFVHRLTFQKNTTFRKLGTFPSSCGRSWDPQKELISITGP
jgi:hypothetical protein